jgi:glyoxylase-like metal-dependent hydrolase (beta-lactamase superfamily II)
MDNISYQFELGKYKCTTVSDGSLPIPNHPPMPVNCLYVQTGKNNVLIDTGEGPGVNPTSGKLFKNLQAAGIKNTEVDTIIISHAHIDHLGGNTDAKGNLVYPNAHIFMEKVEWEYWVPRLNLKPGEELPGETVHIPSARRNILPIKDRYIIVEDKKEIVPGFRFLPAHGHTPGNSAIIVSSGDKQLIFVGDLLHEIAEFSKPDMWAQWDFNPEESIRTRTEIINRAVETRALVFISHFPFPGLGYIVKKGNSLDWEPYQK